MDNTTQLMELYSTCFTVSMVITIAAAALAVFLFFRFNIRGIYAIRSGRAKQREIREMEERNRRTGKLREDGEFDFDSACSRDKSTVKTGPTKSSGNKTARAGKTVQGFRFDITEYTAVVHTDEIIE